MQAAARSCALTERFPPARQQRAVAVAQQGASAARRALGKETTKLSHPARLVGYACAFALHNVRRRDAPGDVVQVQVVCARATTPSQQARARARVNPPLYVGFMFGTAHCSTTSTICVLCTRAVLHLRTAATRCRTHAPQRSAIAQGDGQSLTDLEPLSLSLQTVPARQHSGRHTSPQHQYLASVSPTASLMRLLTRHVPALKRQFVGHTMHLQRAAHLPPQPTQPDQDHPSD